MIPHRFWILLLTSGSLSLLSCTDLGEPTQSSIPYNLALWHSKNIHSYTVEQTRGCECPGPFHVKVTVHEDVIKSVLDLADSSLVPQSDWSKWLTIDGLFRYAESAQSRNPYRLDVQFDPLYGYPAYVYVDYSASVADDEVLTTVKNLIPL